MTTGPRQSRGMNGHKPLRGYVLDLEHPDVAQAFVLSHMQQRPEMIFFMSPPVTFQGKYEEAAPLYERSQAIQEKVLGPKHPGV
ncbi:unnamed protein product, partial [Ectocarpus sp. 8 AP-2014]